MTYLNHRVIIAVNGSCRGVWTMRSKCIAGGVIVAQRRKSKSSRKHRPQSGDERPFAPAFHGVVTVGERGQIVIPARLRRAYDIHHGDKLLVFSHPSGLGVLLLKLEALERLWIEIQASFEAVQSTLGKTQR